VPAAIKSDRDERAVFEICSPSGNVVVKTDAQGFRLPRELAALAAAAVAGIPVPKVVHADTSLPTLLVLALIGGAPLQAGTGDQAWREAGRWLRELHSLKPPSDVRGMGSPDRTWREHFLWWANHECEILRQAGSVDPATVERTHYVLTEVFGAMSEPELRLLHGDCQEEHFLVRPDGGIAGIIDFGDACRGDPVWDLAVLTIRSPERLEELLAGYMPEPVLDQRMQELLPAYQLMRHIGSARWMNEHGFDGATDLEAAQRVLDQSIR
jgi:aminoglycoside phosphotransferase (APT) family kinase protein